MRETATETREVDLQAWPRAQEADNRGPAGGCCLGSLVLACCLVFTGLHSPVTGADAKSPGPWEELAFEPHGFIEQRAGSRLHDDPYEQGVSVMETRLQLDVASMPQWGELKFKGDACADGVTVTGEFDLREANIQFSPTRSADVKIGRQALTWGTGDLIFINDLFPKDWESFFVGRDMEYLKAPSDAVKINAFLNWFDWQWVYTPQFDSDRYIDGGRISYWSPSLGRTAGQDAEILADRPDRWFNSDEIATRMAKRVKGWEVALYGYWGYWKSPAGFDPSAGRPYFPDLDVYGASLEGPFRKGIANVEIGWYDSKEDRHGDNPLVNNSEMRYLVGYRQEIGKDLTAGVQYYCEQILQHDRYILGVPAVTARDEFRHLLTLRLTQLLMNQNLRCSLFAYYSPSDQDAYLRPNLHYKATDNLALELGANVFTGSHPHTFFGQFEDNTNLYGAIRYSF